MWYRKASPKKRGYTLPELAVVTGILGLVAAMATVGIIRHRQNAEDLKMQAELTSIYKAMQAYRLVHGAYPSSYAQLQEFISVPNFSNRYEINQNPGG